MTKHPSKAKYYMTIALEEALLAFERDEVPIGAVMVNSRTGNIVGRASNRTIEHHDPTAHAEMILLREICAKEKAQRIPDMDIYVTVEPCPMCAAALSFARIRHVIFGASDPKSGGITSVVDLYNKPPIHHKPMVTGGIMAEECATIMQEFFALKRQKNN